MSLTKKVFVDEITVKENGIVLVREATQITDDGKEISRQFHRTSYVPGDDVSNQPPEVQAICAAVWTPEMIEKFNAVQGA